MDSRDDPLGLAEYAGGAKHPLLSRVGAAVLEEIRRGGAGIKKNLEDFINPIYGKGEVGSPEFVKAATSLAATPSGAPEGALGTGWSMGAWKNLYKMREWAIKNSDGDTIKVVDKIMNMNPQDFYKKGSVDAEGEYPMFDKTKAIKALPGEENEWARTILGDAFRDHAGDLVAAQSRSLENAPLPGTVRGPTIEEQLSPEVQGYPGTMLPLAPAASGGNYGWPGLWDPEHFLPRMPPFQANDLTRSPKDLSLNEKWTQVLPYNNLEVGPWPGSNPE